MQGKTCPSAISCHSKHIQLTKSMPTRLKWASALCSQYMVQAWRRGIHAGSTANCTGLEFATQRSALGPPRPLQRNSHTTSAHLGQHPESLNSGTNLRQPLAGHVYKEGWPHLQGRQLSFPSAELLPGKRLPTTTLQDTRRREARYRYNMLEVGLESWGGRGRSCRKKTETITSWWPWLSAHAVPNISMHSTLVAQDGIQKLIQAKMVSIKEGTVEGRDQWVWKKSWVGGESKQGVSLELWENEGRSSLTLYITWACMYLKSTAACKLAVWSWRVFQQVPVWLSGGRTFHLHHQSESSTEEKAHVHASGYACVWTENRSSSHSYYLYHVNSYW